MTGRTSTRRTPRRRALWGSALLLVPALVFTAAAKQAQPEGGPASLKVLCSEPYAPVVRVLDTESSLGPLAAAPRTVTLRDLVKFHGHPCDGLVAASAGITYGLHALFPKGVVDRTDVVVAVNASPCYGDAAAYLTGARARYHTLIVDKNLHDTWILHRRSTGKTVAVSLKPGIKPATLPSLEEKLRAEGCDQPLIRKVQALQIRYSEKVLSMPPSEVFELKTLPSFPYKFGGMRADAAKAHCPRED
ncbi:MAG: formylmethanofuran dehydrogenase subunit E family protein [Acidobacteriota bacterium]